MLNGSHAILPPAQEDRSGIEMLTTLDSLLWAVSMALSRALCGPGLGRIPAVFLQQPHMSFAELQLGDI